MRRRLLRPERTPLYNPQLLPEEALIHLFTAHVPLFERLIDDLGRADRQHVPPHKLIVGPPGSGKTMMLQRLRIAMTRGGELADGHHPIAFPEELYGVSSVADLGEVALRRLVGALPRRQRRQVITDGDPWAALTGFAQASDQRLVLLIDHLDRVLDRLPQSEEWTLRELLQRSHLVVVGTSTTPIASDVDFGKAFYDPFQLHELRHLNDRVALSLLGKLLRGVAPDGALDPSLAAKVRSILLLSGGQVRTLMLLRRAIGDRRRWTVSDLVETILDHYTPRYRAQIERLPAQWQRVLAALAWGWHPLRPADIAEVTGIGARQAASLLGRLVREDLVRKVPQGPGSGRTGYQVADRFLNAWLVMRRGGEQRQRLRRFLELAEEVLLTEGALEIPRLKRALDRLKPSVGAPPDRWAPELVKLLESAGSAATSSLPR